MIPYEDLVIALQTWRAKQGLPVAQLSGALTPPPQVEMPVAAAAPQTRPPGPPPRAPGQSGGFLSNVATPPPLERPSEMGMDVDDAALLEEAHYENEGDDFAMAFPPDAVAGEVGDDSTAIGESPRASDNTLDDGGTEVASPGGKLRGTGRNDDW